MTLKEVAIIWGLLFAVPALALGPPAERKGGSKSGTEQELAALLEEWDQVYFRRDTASLEHLLSEEFLFTNASGRVSSKREYIMACVKAPDMTRVFDSPIEDVRARVYGDVAVVTSLGGRRGQNISRDPGARYRYTDVFVKRHGSWRAVASQATLSSER